MHKLSNNRNNHHPLLKNSRKEVHHQPQQKSKAQEASLLSLLRRNRSLKELQQYKGSRQNQGESRVEEWKGQAGKKQTSGRQVGHPKQQKRQINDLKKLIGDEYLLIRGGQKRRREKIATTGVERENIKEHGKNTGSRQRSQMRLSYDPNNYNWRKSNSKSEDRGRVSQSPKVIQPFRMSESEYYQPHLNNQMKNIQGGQQEKQQERPQSRASKSGHGRSKSALSRPKVVRNIFQAMSPKNNRHSVSSTKSLFFTFGL